MSPESFLDYEFLVDDKKAGGLSFKSDNKTPDSCQALSHFVSQEQERKAKENNVYLNQGL